MSGPLPSFALFLFKVFCAAVIVISCAFTVWTVGPNIETRLFPVVGKLDIVRIAPGEMADTTVIVAGFNKLRDCEYVGISWFRGERGKSFERVPVQLLRSEGDTSSPNRPVGYQKAGPWIVGVPYMEFAPWVRWPSHPTKNFAELYHRCHPFWVTRTEFWP